MKNKIIFSLLFSAILLSACSGDHASRQGSDTAAMWHATNPYRDTFATTSTTGDATTVDNSGSGGTKIVRPHVVPQTAVVDTTKK